MEDTKQIQEELRQKSAINDIFVLISKARIPVERSVIVEKYKAPICILPKPYEEIEVEGDDDFMNMFLGARARSWLTSEMAWYNSAGQLHSFSDAPSRIIWTSSKIEIEWHRNGEPYRNNFKFNKIVIEVGETYSSELSRYVKTKDIIQFQWLNKRGLLHSFNDMPAFISDDGVRWYWNGKTCRMGSPLSYELPCSISKFGEMVFQRRHDDVPESVKYPLSTKHYGKASLEDLRRYEKYVQWPIRELLTL